MGRPGQTFEVGGRELTVSNLDKVLYPQTGFTKGDVLEYYVRAAPVLIPHLRGRAISLKRYPDGVAAPYFYQKSCPPHPGWFRTQRVWSEGRGEDIEYATVADLASLVWLVNLGDLEMHTFLALARHSLHPTTLAFDLDPGPGCGLVACSRVALAVRDALRSDGLAAWPKVSGSKGMQLYVPLNVPTGPDGHRLSFEHTKTYARSLAERLAAEQPALITSIMRKSERARRVLIDWSQNDDHKTTVCVYSLRGTAQPQVSLPVSWAEVEDAAARRTLAQPVPELVFTPAQALPRMRRDAFAPVLAKRQRLPVPDASVAPSATQPAHVRRALGRPARAPRRRAASAAGPAARRPASSRRA